MKKSILNLGNALNKAEQKEINGGSLSATCSELYRGNILYDPECMSKVISRCQHLCETGGGIILT